MTRKHPNETFNSTGNYGELNLNSFHCFIMVIAIILGVIGIGVCVYQISNYQPLSNQECYIYHMSNGTYERITCNETMSSSGDRGVDSATMGYYAFTSMRII